MKERRGSRGASAPKRAAAEEPAYEGPLGRTMLTPVHVTIPGGFVRSVRVYTSVNVTTDPELREAALSGALHRFEGGEELSIPFLYHDAADRRFCLVVPESLRHRELEERAQLLQQLADDREHAVPTYVRDAQVVIGLRDLERYLTAPAGLSSATIIERHGELTRAESKNDDVRKALDAREAEIVEREQRLATRAEEVTRREDDHRSQAERLEAQRRDLELREQELERRFEALAQRESSLGQTPPKKPSSHPPPPPPEARRASSKPPPLHPQVVDEDVEEIDDIAELEPVGTNPTGALTEAVPLAEVIGPEEVEEIIDEDEVEELDDADVVQEVTGVTENPIDATTDEHPLREGSTKVESAEGLVSPVEPPDGFLEDPERQMVAVRTPTDGVWLFTRVEGDQRNAFDGRRDLLAQLAVVQGYPVVVLALVAAGEGRPYVRRAALDPHATDDRAVLDMLRRKFEATVALFGPDGTFERTFEVSAPPRRVNVAMLLERIGRMSAKDATVDPATAIERALTAPPPVREPDIPFQSEEPPPSENARQAAAALSRLSDWSAPDKLDRALFALSIPRDVVDGSMRRVLDDAVKHGLALPTPLVSRAVSVGVAPEPGALVARQIQQFKAVVASDGRGGLSEEEIATNWEALLEAANENEVAIDGKTHELAWRSIRHLRGESTGSHNFAEIPPEKLPDMGSPELVLLLEHPKMRRMAAMELCRRSEPDLLETLYRAVRKMPRAEVVRVVPRVVEFGEAAGDALIDGLTARKTFVRQASALGLGHLKLRRAVVPLLHLLQNEPTEVWREVARVLGEFGSAAFRSLSRAVKDPRGNEEKLTLALAHIANHGCQKQVEDLGKTKDKAVAVLALEALTLRQTAKKDAQQVRGEIPVPEDAPIKQFSRRFYQELEGTAPEADLVDSEA